MRFRAFQRRLPSSRVEDRSPCRARRRTFRLRAIVSFDEADADRIRHRGWQRRPVPLHDRADRCHPGYRLQAAQATRSTAHPGRLALAPRAQRLLGRIEEPPVPRGKSGHRLPLHPCRPSDRNGPRLVRAALSTALEHTCASRRHRRKWGMTLAWAVSRNDPRATCHAGASRDSGRTQGPLWSFLGKHRTASLPKVGTLRCAMFTNVP